MADETESSRSPAEIVKEAGAAADAILADSAAKAKEMRRVADLLTSAAMQVGDVLIVVDREEPEGGTMTRPLRQELAAAAESLKSTAGD